MNLSRQSKDALCDDEGALSQRTSVSNNLELKNCNFLVLDANLHSCYILPLPSSRTLTTMPCCIKLTFMSRQIEKHVLETWLVDTFTPQADGLYNPSKTGASSRQMVRHTGTHTVWNLSCTIVNLAPLAVSALTRGIWVFILRFWYLRICGKGSHFMVLSWSNKYPTLLF